MILASLLSRGAIAGEPGPANHRPDRLGPVALLGLSAWCGTIAGLLEVATVVVRKRFFDTNQLLSMSRHFIWLVPLTDLLIFLLVGLVGSLVVILRPAGGRWAVARTLCALTLLPMLLVAFPQVYGLAWLLVALGLSARLVPILERHGSAFRRVVLYSSPILAGDAGGPRGARPGRPIGSSNGASGAADPAGRPQHPPDRDGHRRRRSPRPLRLRAPDQPRDRRAGPARQPVRRRTTRPPRGPSHRTRACSPGDGLTSCRSAGGPRSTRPRRRWPSSCVRGATPRRASSPTRRIAPPTRGWAAASPSIATTSSTSSRRSRWRCWSSGPSTGCRRSGTCWATPSSSPG